MSELVGLLGFNHSDFASREQWALDHSSDHDDIREAIQAQGGPNLTPWQLFPVNWGDWESYAQRHQTAHNDFNAALGLSGTDLTGVDFKDQKSVELWQQNHFSEHQAARSALGI